MSKGGRRNAKSAKGRVRPAGETLRAVIEHIRCTAPPSPPQDTAHFFPSLMQEKLLCSLSQGSFPAGRAFLQTDSVFQFLL